MILTIDTQKESSAELKRIIALLQDVVNERSPSSFDQPVSSSEVTPTPDMFQAFDSSPVPEKKESGNPDGYQILPY